MSRRLVFGEHFDPTEDGEHVEVRRVESGSLRVTIEAPIAAGEQTLALARDLHQEIQLWLALDKRA